MLFRHCLFFIATALLTFSVAIPIPSGAGQHPKPQNGPANPGSHKLTYTQRRKIKAEAAIERMHQTKNLPRPNDQFSVGEHSFTGEQVKGAIANFFRTRHRIYPRPYKNFPYYETHIDPSLRGKRPIPHNPANLKEFPLTDQKNGWRGEGPVGPGRIIMSEEGGHDVFHGVVGHDDSRGGGDGEHYLATHTKEGG